MAMPPDFWRNAQSLNIFRTKPCQRLAQDGICGWKSQCQYSHCIDWPRRQPLKHAYSPMMCPNVRMSLLGENGNGSSVLDKPCPAGLRCPMAHSKEEVLFHPDIFKTTLCEENDGSQRTSRAGKRHSCHRYYCPLAHGSQELRSSSLSEEYRKECLRALDLFPSDTCCKTCAPSWNSVATLELNPVSPYFYMEGDGVAPWPQADLASFMASANIWGPPSDTTDSPHHIPFSGWPQDEYNAEEDTTDANAYLYAIQKKTLGNMSDPFQSWSGLDESPAFIDIADDGSMSIGPRQFARTEPQHVSLDTKPGMVYTML